MTSFKQKLKYLLNDSSSFRLPLSNEQKFGQIILKTYRKIKRDNNRQSIILSSYKSPKNSRENSKINFLSKIDSYCSKKQKGMSPKNVENMIQTLSIIKQQKSSFYNNATISSPKNKYLNDTSKKKQKLLRDIDCFKNDNSNSKNKYMICNRHKSSFNNKKFNNNIKNNIKNNMEKKNITMHNLMRIKNNDSIFFHGNNKDNLKDENNNIFDYFNRIYENQKNMNNNNKFKYSRNKESYTCNYLFKKKFFNFK